jgi:hypothetical protein
MLTALQGKTFLYGIFCVCDMNIFKVFSYNRIQIQRTRLHEPTDLLRDGFKKTTSLKEGTL